MWCELQVHKISIALLCFILFILRKNYKSTSFNKWRSSWKFSSKIDNVWTFAESGLFLVHSHDWNCLSILILAAKGRKRSFNANFHLASPNENFCSKRKLFSFKLFSLSLKTNWSMYTIFFLFLAYLYTSTQSSYNT